MKVKLREIAHARSGDKGDLVNLGVIAYAARDYEVLLREVTAARVKEYFGDLVLGEVTRYELPAIGAVNFVCRGALMGGGTLNLRSDAQGKSFGGRILGMEVEVG
jgi:hypothetical protein